jgi:hypothetical protein
MNNAAEIIRADGIVRPHFRDQWVTRAATQLGRMDARSTGGYQPRFDGSERPYVDIALGVMRAVMTGRMDSAETVFVQRALVFVDNQPFATLIPPLKARTFVPTTVKGNPGDETYLYRRITRTGMARFIAPGAGLDLPRSNLYVDEISQRAYPLGVEIVYNYFELLAVGAALANGQPVDLVGENMRAALEGVEKKLDIVAAFGTATPPTGFVLEVDVDLGITGLLNNAYATVYTVATGAANGTAWSTKTPDEVLADLNGIVGSQVATTYEVHRPDTILVPLAQFEQQLTRRMSDVSDTTIIEFFQKTRREMGNPVEIIPWMYMAGAGTASADLMLAFKRDPRMFEHILLMDATPLAPSTVGLETTQPVIAKTVGVVVRYPLSISKGSGI